MGDQSQKVKIRWVPSGASYHPAKEAAFDKNFPIWLMRHTVAAFGLTPQDLGWTDDVNRSTGETQTDVQFRISTMPKSIGVQAVLNDITQNDLGLRVQVRFDTGREKEDRLQEAQAMAAYVEMGAISPDEVRSDIFGKKIQADEMCPRFILSERLGPIPLAYLISVGGVVDKLTGSPEPGTVVPSQFVLAGNQAPDPMSTPEEQKLMAVAVHSATNADHALALPPELKETAEQATQSNIDAVEGKDTLPPAAPAKNSQPGQNPPMNEPNSPSPNKPVTVKKEEIGEFDFGAIAKAMRNWRKSSRDRVRRGYKTRLYVDASIPPEVSDFVWQKLEKATTREEVDAAFDVEKANITKEDAHYRTAAFPTINCETCSHMLDSGMCDFLDQPVAPDMVCDYFAYKGGLPDQDKWQKEFIQVRTAAERIESHLADLAAD